MTVYLVGAGPGDPGLITVRGLELIKRADVIIYDRLVNPDFLKHAKGRCEKIYVGKGPGHHSMSQDEINRLLIEKGRRYECVVRLKGGDPFVFGRGGEEMEELIRTEIPFEIVPGITSAIAGPAYAGIPVTHRGNNTSVTFITGHRWDSSRIKETYSSLTGTLVILMGAGSFPEIGKDLMGMGYEPNTPVSAIHNATSAIQKVISGPLEDMTRRSIPAPSVIIVGGAHFTGNGWFERKLGLLRGKKVLVMRTEEQFNDTKALLEVFGAKAISGGHYELTPIDWDRKDIDAATHIVVTSANTVPLLKEDLLANKGKTFIAIGPGTRRALEDIGLGAEMPDDYTSEGLGMLIRRMAGKDDVIVGFRSLKASNVLESMLSGLYYREIPVYDIEYEGIDEDAIRFADIIFFTSTAMVNAISHLVGEGQVLISIGPQTTSALVSCGLSPDMESQASNIDSMICALMDVLYTRLGEG